MPSKTSDPSRDNEPITMEEVSKEAQNIIDKVVKDVGKSSATKQLIIGCTSGWLTGYVMMKVGKVAAVSIGGAVILLQVANHQGFIKVNWDKLSKKVDDLGDTVEASTSKKGPKFLDKVERFVDRKLDKVEATLKKKEKKVKKWYHHTVLEDDAFIFEEIHVFMACFIAGMAFGMVSGKII